MLQGCCKNIALSQNHWRVSVAPTTERRKVQLQLRVQVLSLRMLVYIPPALKRPRLVLGQIGNQIFTYNISASFPHRLRWVEASPGRAYGLLPKQRNWDPGAGGWCDWQSAYQLGYALAPCQPAKACVLHHVTQILPCVLQLARLAPWAV